MSLLGDPMAVVKFAAYTDADAASNVAIAAVAGYKIRILSYSLSASGGIQNITFQSAAVALSGAMDVADNATIHATCMAGLFETTVGVAFNVLQGQANLLAGHFSYVLIPDPTLNETG